MSYRKRKLLFIQTLLLITALLLLYIFYYHGSKEADKSTSLNEKKEEVPDENVPNYFEDVEYKGIDANGNRYLLVSKIASFNEDSPELINMIGMNATFYFRGGKVLTVTGEKGKYNNKTNDMNFRNNVKVTESNNIIFAENLDFFNLKKLIKVYGNVRGQSLDGNFTADILRLDIDNQAVDFSMINNEKVKINLKRWKRDLG